MPRQRLIIRDTNHYPVITYGRPFIVLHPIGAFAFFPKIYGKPLYPNDWQKILELRGVCFGGDAGVIWWYYNSYASADNMQKLAKYVGAIKFRKK